MIASYSRERSSFSRSINCWRVIVVSCGVVAFAIVVSCRIFKLNRSTADLFLQNGVPMRSLLFALVVAQTAITPPPNKYSPEQDVELGRQAAAQVREQLPLLHDDAVTSFVEDVGRRLVAAIPPELRHPEFRYTF